MGYLLIVLVLISHNVSIDISELPKDVSCIRDESVNPVFESREEPREEPLELSHNPPDTINWIPIDSITLTTHLMENERVVVSFDPTTETIECFLQPDTLPSSVQEAVDISPDWLEANLIDNFRKLPFDFQLTYADLLSSSPDPRLVDEIAFQIAHIGWETLIDTTFDPNLLVENAQYLYQNDDSLLYADILDYGRPPWDDYWSTVGYWAVEKGETVQYVIPKEIYYYYIVHPQLSDESPRMDGYVYNRFWRDYLFYNADSSYPLLGEKLKRVKVLWEATDTAQVYPPGRSFDSTDVALDVIGNWVSETVPVMATGNRPIQPNVIAHEHNGNCGELQDVLQGAARSALIPVVATMNICEDHVWNEFYYKGWKEYQIDRGYGVTHINDFSTAYDDQHGGSKKVSSVWNWRSDGYAWTRTGSYSNSCSLHVEVKDARGLPVDGARVLIYSEYIYGGLTVTTWGFTDSNGRCSFELGELRNFYVHINSPIGDYPEGADEVVKVISYSLTGAHYYKTFYIPNFIQIPRSVLAPPPSQPSYTHKFELEVEVPYEILHGYVRARRDCEDTGYYHTYSKEGSGGRLDLFVVDEENFLKYESNDEFEASLIAKNLKHGTLEFISPELKKWYFVLSNEDVLTTSRGLEVKMRLYKNQEVAIGEEFAGAQANFWLGLATPNPFRRNTTISFSTTSPGWVNLSVYDAKGALVNTLLKGFIQPGNHTTLWDRFNSGGKKAPSGVYFYRLTQNGRSLTKKVVLID